MDETGKRYVLISYGSEGLEVTNEPIHSTRESAVSELMTLIQGSPLFFDWKGILWEVAVDSRYPKKATLLKNLGPFKLSDAETMELRLEMSNA